MINRCSRIVVIDFFRHSKEVVSSYGLRCISAAGRTRGATVQSAKVAFSVAVVEFGKIEMKSSHNYALSKFIFELKKQLHIPVSYWSENVKLGIICNRQAVTSRRDDEQNQQDGEEG